MFRWWLTIAVLAVLVCAAPCLADDIIQVDIPTMRQSEDRSQLNITLRAVATGLIIFDVYQTDVAIKNGGYESGPFTFILGKYPSTEKLITFGAIAIASVYTISDWLPPEWRTLFLIGVIVVEYYCISHSYGTNLVFRF